ncbi:hypothetical protein QQF64_034079 [Cirrhinus molitorella]|uniref:Uncharacterized protein n=1 Tax=Cirrhinus molitorella TaxID=172907 RepID=A0ABR3MVU5_9TELE
MERYLVSLNRTITALSTNEIAESLRLYSFLHAIDQSLSKYSLKCKKKVLAGPWRASQKRSGSTPGFLTDKKELTEMPCYKECSFPSLLVWQMSHCQSLESSHLHLLNMDMLPLNSRSLKIMRFPPSAKPPPQGWSSLPLSQQSSAPPPPQN